MKKIFLFFGTLFFLSLTISSFAQERTLNKNQEKKKTENLEKSDAAVKKDEEIPMYEINYNLTPEIAIISPHYNEKKIKLKVTLLELQSDVTQNKKTAHLSINQHVRYESKGKVIKPTSKNVGKHDECGLGQLFLIYKGWGAVQAPRGEKVWEGATPLFCGDRENQTHVTQSKQPLSRNPNINHSVVFELTPDQVNDKNAEFLIDTFVVEYSTSWGTDTSIELNEDPRRTKVAIHDVLAILQGKKKLNEDTRYIKDGGVPPRFLFDHFDGISLPLRNVNKNGKMILEGPIRARNKGKDLIEKAFVWMRFELID